jgi:hypothetical protein
VQRGRHDGLVEEMEAGESRLPHKRRNLALAHRLARRLLEAYEGWIEEVEAVLGDGARRAGGAPTPPASSE